MTIVDYFELLGLTPRFSIDEAALESAYFKQQKLYHPDRFAGKPPEERMQALSRSMALNQAYQTLKQPLSRAQYILSLHGILVGTERDTVKPSTALLTENMEWREQIEETTETANLLAIEQKINAAQTISIQQIEARFLAADWQAMAQEVLHLNYIIKTQEDVARRKHSLHK